MNNVIKSDGRIKEFNKQKVLDVIEGVMTRTELGVDRIISSEEALKDVIPIEWSEDLLSGEKKVVIDKYK